MASNFCFKKQKLADLTALELSHSNTFFQAHLNQNVYP